MPWMPQVFTAPIAEARRAAGLRTPASCTSKTPKGSRSTSSGLGSEPYPGWTSLRARFKLEPARLGPPVSTWRWPLTSSTSSRTT